MASNQHDINLACECGATLKISHGVSPWREEDRTADEQLAKDWQGYHSGYGHGPCTPYEARSIRYNEKRRTKGIDDETKVVI